jgi:hypothetical protein
MSDLQLAFLFPYFPFLGLIIAFVIVELITGGNDEDDDNNHDGGLMSPAYVPASNPT